VRHASAARPQAQRWDPDDGLDVVRTGRLGVEYEPIVEISSGRLHGYEALARFHHHDGAVVPPARVFERLRDHPELLVRTELALKRLQLAHAPGPRVFLNVSAETWYLDAPAFLDVLGGARVDVVVEAVENVRAAPGASAVRMIRDLARAGIPAALDDLGGPDVVVCAEELSLARVLKFDRSVLRRMHDPSRRALLESLLSFAAQTRKSAVAEGVETPADLEAARALGFDLAQGTLFRAGCRRFRPR
jgi:EAL domain-containing protein (putative c-di-GMP-specific phosphodiesterase class I)